MQKSRQRQQGLTLISWIIVLALVAFVFWFCFSLFPIYYQYYAINSVVRKTAESVSAGETASQILGSMDMKFTINGVQDPDLTPEKVVKITTAPDGTSMILTLDYNARTSFIGNVFLSVHFHKTYTAVSH
ncbi:MAG: DUF4845 domain-containing protein [Gammaproteobacteria bacterium]